MYKKETTVNQMAFAPPKDPLVTDGSQSSHSGKSYSGKIELQIPRSLHQKLIDMAKDENVSLEHFIIYKLAQNSV